MRNDAPATGALRAARDLLQANRTDYAAAMAGFSWPVLDEFNWALDWFDVTAAEHVGKVSGSAEFIKQLPAAHGPTRNLTKGTGIEEAEIKGHYLILIWTEFTDLKAPKGKTDFIRGLQQFFNAREVELAKELPDLRAQLLNFPSPPIDAPRRLLS